jgi:hypothetical protein
VKIINKNSVTGVKNPVPAEESSDGHRNSLTGVKNPLPVEESNDKILYL